MSNTIIKAKVNNVRRLPNTLFGNPKYELRTDQGRFRTPNNAGYVYGVNFWNLEGLEVTLEINSRGTIAGIES